MLEIISLHPWREEGWETLRTIRNECAEFMTGRTTPISCVEQDEYRDAFDTRKQAAHVLYNAGHPVGFLYLRRVGDHFVPTYGVREDSRNMGFGKVLVRLSQALTGHMILEVRRDNHVAVRLYENEGFKYLLSCDTPETYRMEWRRS